MSFRRVCSFYDALAEPRAQAVLRWHYWSARRASCMRRRLGHTRDHASTLPWCRIAFLGGHAGALSPRRHKPRAAAIYFFSTSPSRRSMCRFRRASSTPAESLRRRSFIFSFLLLRDIRRDFAISRYAAVISRLIVSMAIREEASLLELT